MKKLSNRSWLLSLSMLAFIAMAYTTYLALAYSGQAPLDLYAFRQSQTALTAYWFLQDGFKFAYETPVAGFPWSIPFEFPIYQLIVALLSHYLNISLDATGRLVSYLFFLLSIGSVYSITKKLNLSFAVYIIFIAVAFSMPIYVYWSRSFMIETAALFFSLMSIVYFLDYFNGRKSLKVILLFLLYATLAVLQKATTALPVLFILSLVYFFREVKNGGAFFQLVLSKRMLLTGMLFIIPILIGYAWVVYTDSIKMLNPLGAKLTSAALAKWNWGTLGQRFSGSLWGTVFWKRIFVINMCGALGLFICLVPFFLGVHRYVKTIILCALAMGVAPLLLFTNLHIIHDYYQSANILYFAYALAVSLGVGITSLLGGEAVLLALFLIMLSNYAALNSGFVRNIKMMFDKTNRDVAVGDVLKRELPRDKEFVAFGNDWSSTFSYMSERKSFTVPDWFEKYGEVVEKPENFIRTGRLGGVVSCGGVRPDVSDLFKWSGESRTWKVGIVQGCTIATPAGEFKATQWKSVHCAGGVDSVDVIKKDGKRFVNISGWSLPQGGERQQSDAVYMAIDDGHGQESVLQAFSIPRMDVNRHFGISDSVDAGFSRVLRGEMGPVTYQVRLVHVRAGQAFACDASNAIHLE